MLAAVGILLCLWMLVGVTWYNFIAFMMVAQPLLLLAIVIFARCGPEGPEAEGTCSDPKNGPNALLPRERRARTKVLDRLSSSARDHLAGATGRSFMSRRLSTVFGVVAGAAAVLLGVILVVFPSSAPAQKAPAAPAAKRTGVARGESSAAPAPAEAEFPPGYAERRPARPATRSSSTSSPTPRWAASSCASRGTARKASPARTAMARARRMPTRAAARASAG